MEMIGWIVAAFLYVSGTISFWLVLETMNWRKGMFFCLWPFFLLIIAIVVIFMEDEHASRRHTSR